MKQFSLVLVLSLIGSFAQAGYLAAGSLNMHCQTPSVPGEYPLALELIQTNSQSFGENEQVPFQLKIRTVQPASQDVWMAPEVYKGTAKLEDVQVTFQSSNGKVSLLISLDELDQATLQIAGQPPLSLSCKH